MGPMACSCFPYSSWAGLAHRGCLVDHQTTWVDLPCCYWLNLKLQVDFTSLAIHTKLYILGAENIVLKYGGSQSQKSKVSRPLFSLVLVAGDMICLSENLMKRGLWSRLVTREKLPKFLQLMSHSHTYTYFAHPIDFFALPILKKKNTNLSGTVSLWYESWC